MNPNHDFAILPILPVSETEGNWIPDGKKPDGFHWFPRRWPETGHWWSRVWVNSPILVGHSPILVQKGVLLKSQSCNVVQFTANPSNETGILSCTGQKKQCFRDYHYMKIQYYNIFLINQNMAKQQIVLHLNCNVLLFPFTTVVAFF